MREMLILVGIFAAAMGIAGGVYSYVTTSATGAPMHDTIECPYCGGASTAQNPTGKFIGDWKCMRCLKSFKQ